MVSIDAKPQLTLFDEKVNIAIHGVEPGSKVTLRSQVEETKMKFEAHAHYQADDKGVVLLAEHNSLGGTYEGLEPMGMFWSMKASPGQKPGLRYMKKGATTTMDVTLSIYDGHLNTDALDSMEPLAKTLVKKTYMGPNVERLKVHHGRIRGMLFKPKGPGPFPGIIDMFGAVGGVNEFRSALLASRGFASFSLPFFAYEDLPKTFDNIELEYFEEGINWLMSQTFVMSGGVGTIGSSTAGSIVLYLATYFPEKVKAAISINGNTANLMSGFSYKGVKFPVQEYDKSKLGDNRFRGSDIFTEPKTWDKEMFIKVEKAKGQILFIVGEDDHNWPSSQMAHESIARLKGHGKDNYQLLSYHNVGHIIEPPYAPLSIKTYHRMWGGVQSFGGSFKEGAHAQEDSWHQIMKFLYKHVGGLTYTHPEAVISKL